MSLLATDLCIKYENSLKKNGGVRWLKQEEWFWKLTLNHHYEFVAFKRGNKTLLPL